MEFVSGKLIVLRPRPKSDSYPATFTEMLQKPSRRLRRADRANKAV